MIGQTKEISFMPVVGHRSGSADVMLNDFATSLLAILYIKLNLVFLLWVLAVTGTAEPLYRNLVFSKQ